MDSEKPKKNDEIWLEEKILPTTTWVENLVKPLTIWMEQKINAPEKKVDSQKGSHRREQGSNLEPNEIALDNTAEAVLLISSEQAGVLAKEHIAGEVLYIKLMSSGNRYRVKLISTLGEIHSIYVNAISGEIVLRDNKIGPQAVEPIVTEQGVLLSEPDSEGGGRP